MNFTPSVRNLFFDQLQDMLGMEALLLKAMPRLAALSHHPSLRAFILGWREDIDVRCVEISEIFTRSQLSPGNAPNMAMTAIIEWGEADLEAIKNFPIRDLMVVAHCLRLSYHTTASREIVGRLAERLGLAREAKILKLMGEQEARVTEDLLELEMEIFQIAADSSSATAVR
jgi:ferritin-like metal-binding protein YciE